MAVAMSLLVAGSTAGRAQGTPPPGAASPAPRPAASVSVPTTAAVGGTISADSVPALRVAPPPVAATAGTPAPASRPNAPLATPDSSAEFTTPLPNGGIVALDRVVAVVGDQPVLWSTVLERINVARAQNQVQIPPDSLGQLTLARNVTNDLVNEELLVQKAKTIKVEVTDEDVATGVDQQMKRVRNQFGSEAEYRAELKKAGFGNPEEYRKTLIEQAKRSQLQQRTIEKLKEDGKLIPVGVSESDITAAFESSKGQLPKRPATVTFRQIVVAPRPTPAAKGAAKAKADSILAELKQHGTSGEEFAQVAKRESMDQGTREQGGDLGWNRRGNMVPEFDRWMFALPPGQVSPVIETVFGYHIIRVERVKPAEVKASHILIRWKIDSSQVEAARVEADSVLAIWKAGAGFDTLAARHHDPNEEKGSLQPFPRDSLPPSYATAFRGKTTGEFAGPFAIEDKGTGKPKFVIAQIVNATAGGDYTISEFRDKIREQLADERAIARLLESLRKETYVSLRI
jgi:peptidyl-prolyl cis-trans isomerase SurA